MNDNCPRQSALKLGVAILGCAAYATLLAVLPHFVAYFSRGSINYISFIDDLCYLHIASVPFHGDMALRDPYAAEWEGGTCLASWLLYVPIAKLGAAIGCPHILLPMIWRLVGAPIFGAAVFLIFRGLFTKAGWSLGMSIACTIIFLSDAGLMQGRPIIDQVLLLKHLYDGTTPWSGAHAITQYRVITPILTFPFFFLLCGVLLTCTNSIQRVILGGICLGMCCLLYFFAWTAAVVGLSIFAAATIASGLLVKETRAIAFRDVAIVIGVLIVGLAIGSPQVYSNIMTSRDPEVAGWLQRAGIPIKSASHQIPWSVWSIWSYFELIVGIITLVVFRVRGLGLILSVFLGGFLLSNSAWVTRLDFENYHWLQYVTRPFGEIILLCAIAGFAHSLTLHFRWRKLVRSAMIALTIFMVTIALIWIPAESLRAPHAVKYNRIVDELQPMRKELESLSSQKRIAGPPDALAVALLFTPAPSLYWHPYTWNCSTAPTETLHQRHALHGWLLGLDVADYEQLALNEIHAQAASKEERQAIVDSVHSARMVEFRKMDDGGADDAIHRLRIGYLLLPENEPPTRGGNWKEVGSSKEFKLWELQ